MAVQPNRRSLEVLINTLTDGNRTETRKRLYAMRDDHLEMIEGLRGANSKVDFLRWMLDDWRDMKIDQLERELAEFDEMLGTETAA